MPIGFDDIVGEVMTARPATIRVFLDFRMGCVGCPISAFHTVDDACKEHGVDRDEFLAALRAAAERRHGLKEDACFRIFFGQHEQLVRFPDDDLLPAAFDQALCLPRRSASG